MRERAIVRRCIRSRESNTKLSFEEKEQWIIYIYVYFLYFWDKKIAAMIRILQLDRIIFWNNDTTISTIFLCDINRRFRNPPSSIFPIHPLTNLKGISLKDRDRHQIRFQITVSAPIFHSIATRSARLRVYRVTATFRPSTRCCCLTNKVRLSVLDSYTSIPSERQSSSRSRLVHLTHAALFPSAIVGEFPGGERAAICPPVKREETRRVSKREAHTPERGYSGGNNRAMCRLNCLGPNEQASRQPEADPVSRHVPVYPASGWMHRVPSGPLYSANLSRTSDFLSIYRFDFRFTKSPRIPYRTR